MYFDKRGNVADTYEYLKPVGKLTKQVDGIFFRLSTRTFNFHASQMTLNLTICRPGHPDVS